MLAAGALVCLAACRQVLGIETRTEGDPPVALGETCGACVDAACPDAERACAADPECARAAACVVEAGLDNPIGRAACRETHAKGAVTSAFQSIDACMRTDCQADCYGGTGFFAAYSAECQLCTEQSCGDKPSRCVADANCEALAVEAFRDGPAGHDPVSMTRLIAAAFDEGDQEREIGYCPISPGCDLACGFDGANLGCLSDYKWPIALPPTATLEVQALVVDFNQYETPFVGAVVDACRPLGDSCSPLETKVTDATGFASFVLDLDVAAGFRGFARVRAGEVDGKETVATHVFAYPLTTNVRGLAPAFWAETVADAALLVPGGLSMDRAQVAVQYFDCSARRASGISLSVVPGVLDGATTVYRGFGDKTNSEGLVAIFNARPGCLDIGGRDEMGRETHRTRVMATPGVITWVYVYPLSDAPVQGYTCTPPSE